VWTHQSTILAREILGVAECQRLLYGHITIVCCKEMLHTCCQTSWRANEHRTATSQLSPGNPRSTVRYPNTRPPYGATCLVVSRDSWAIHGPRLVSVQCLNSNITSQYIQYNISKLNVWALCFAASTSRISRLRPQRPQTGSFPAGNVHPNTSADLECIFSLNFLRTASFSVWVDSLICMGCQD
jgi:hypothetical protein